MDKLIKSKIDRYSLAGFRLSKSKNIKEKQLSYQLTALAQVAEEIYHEDGVDAEERIKGLFITIPLPKGF